MFAKKINKGFVAALFLVPALLLGGVDGAQAMSVDVTGLSYSDSASGRSVSYDFSSRVMDTNNPNAITIPAGSFTRGSGETGTAYYWGDASTAMPGVPSVNVVPHATQPKATVTPTTSTQNGLEGVAVLYASGTVPTGGATTAWDYTIDLTNFNVDLTQPKIYTFRATLGRPTNDYLEPSVEVIWVKGFHDGISYPANTVIVQARVRNTATDSTVWSSLPVIRMATEQAPLDPAMSSVAVQLHVTSGNTFNASAVINNETVQLLDGSGGGYMAPGPFLRFPDVYPVLNLSEDAQDSQVNFQASTYHEQWSGNYGVVLAVYDPAHLFSAITVQSTNVAVDGPGYLVPTNLTYGYNMWNINQAVTLGTTPPSPTNPQYKFMATGNNPADSREEFVTLSGYVTEFAQITSPLPASGATVSTAPTISWTWPGSTTPDYYALAVFDTTTNMPVWNSYPIPPVSSVSYGGPLVNGRSYRYQINAGFHVGGNGNTSMVQGFFTYTGATTVLSFSGSVKEALNYPATPVNQAGVQVVGAGGSPTMSAPDGSFRVDNIPVGTNFHLMITKSGGSYKPTFSSFFNWNADIQTLLPYALYNTTSYGNYMTLAPPATHGLIVGRVTQLNNPTGYLAGAVLTAVELNPSTQQPTGTSYTVYYNEGVAGGTGTDGFFYIPVPAGAYGAGAPTVVKVSVQPLAGYTFNYTDAFLPVYRDSVSQESFFATTAGAPISFSGVVRKYADDTAYSGALVEQVGNPSVNTTSGPDGTFTLPGLPSGTEFSVKITGDGSFVPTYTRVIRDTADVTAARNYNLFTQTDLNNWGVTSGGAIRGRVINGDNTDAGYVSGAVVTYSSQLGRTDYIVKYEDQFNVLSTGAGTTANGKYYILNVAEGDTVTVTATHPYYTFPLLTDANARKFVTHANAVSEAIVKGTRISGRVAISGYIKDSQTTPVGIKGATVEQVVGLTDPVNATVSNADGLFYLTVPQGATLHLKFSKPQATALTSTYTAEMNFAGDALNPGLGDFNLFPLTKLTTATSSGGWGVTGGNGIIRARVKDTQGVNIAGAVVNYTSTLGRTSYDVCYDDGCSTTNANGGSTLSSNGRYMIRNVEEGDTVTVTATAAGYNFMPRVFHTHANSLHQGALTGTTQDEATIRSRFDAMLTEYNKGAGGNIDTVMAYFSANFLDNGQDKAARRADMLAGMTAGETRTYSGVTVTVSGDGMSAVMVITWNGGDIETIYLAKEGGIWLIVGNQARHSVGVQSQHWGDGYHAGFYVEDTPTTPTLAAVSVTGPGITGSLALTYEPNSGNWYPMAGSPFLGTTPPAGPQTYTITVTEGTTDYPYARTISGYVTEFASISSPFNTFGSPVVFSWRGIPGASGYRVELNNDQGQRIWEKGRIPRNQWGVIYDGAPLVSGKTYTYFIVSEIATGDGRNMSMAQGSFTYSAAAQPVVSYGNYVTDIDGNPIEGAQVEQWNAPLDSVTSSATDGSFTLGNILSRTPFHLKFSMASGHVPTYSAYMGFSSNTFDALGSYRLFTQAEFDALGVEAGKGVIRGRVRDANRNTLAGATVTAWSALGNIYEIRYYDDMTTTYRTTGGTYPSGNFAIMNVVEGDKVVANAQLSGFTFSNPKGYSAYGGAVTQGGINASNSCSYTFNPASVSVALEGNGAGSTFTVTTSASCTWTAVSNNTGWLHVISGTAGVGNGSVGYTVDANTGTARTGTITLGGQSFTVNQAGTGAAQPYVGMWGVMALHRENNDNWYTESTRITFNGDGTGTAVGMMNDGSNAPGSRITPFSESFTYTALLNGDGSYSLTLDFSGDIKVIRLVFSDNGNMAIEDGTANANQVKLVTLVRIDANNNHGNGDVNGPYYHVGYERNIDGVVDPPNGNGAYMSISGSHFFSGTGTYTYTAEANSIYLDGHAGFWVDDESGTVRNYNIAADGLFTSSSGSGRGYFTSDGLAGVGTGSYASNNWVGYLFLKQGDRSYSRADLTGTWAMASLGDTKEVSSQSFSADFGTMTCPATGSCTVSFRTMKNGVVNYNIFPLDVTVAANGGFGPGPGASGAQIGAIGNDGKTLIINPGIMNSTDPSKRRIAVGLKASGTTNLSGGKPYDITTGTLHLGGNYYAFVNIPDASHQISAVQVRYNGNTVNASYEPSDGGWFLGDRLNLGASMPVNARLEIDIQDGVSGPWYRYERTVSGGVAAFVGNVQPSGTITTGAFNFTFNGITGGQKYFVHLFDATHTTMLWHSDRTASLTTIPYNGSALTPGTTYTYEAIAQIGTDISMVTGQFTYGSASTITVSGIVKDASGNAITPGVTVSVVGTGITTTADTASGVFSLPGVPAGTPFALKFTADGYLDIYSPMIIATADIDLNQSSTGSGPFLMYTQANLAGLSSTIWTTGGLMLGRVVDQTYRFSSMVSGAFVTARGSSGTSYPVYYHDSVGAPVRGGTTFYNGVFYVPNVADGDTVTLTASKNGWNFPLSAVTTVHAGAVHMARIGGRGPGLFTMSGNVADIAGAGIAGAKLELEGDGGKSITTGAGGAYTFDGLPKDTHFLIKVTATGYADNHIGPINLTASLSGVGITLWTPAQLASPPVSVTGTNGMVTGRVVDMSLTPLSGAVVTTVQSRSGATYTPDYLGGSGQTLATGAFAVPNVMPGDVVKIQVAKNGFSFAPIYLVAYASATSGRLIPGYASPVAYNSYVTNKDMVPLAGAAITQVGTANTTTSSAAPIGNYILNVPTGIPFNLRFSNSGYASTVTSEMTVFQPVTEPSSNGFSIFTTGEYAGFNVASDKGIIRTRVKDSYGAGIAGATIFYTSSLGNSYAICYDDACTQSLISTQSNTNGRYIIKDVAPGDTVTVTARKEGFTFNARVYHTEAGTVHQGSITGTELYPLWAGSSRYQNNNYYGKFAVTDPNHDVQSVAVTGTGISGTLYLNYHPESGQWWETSNAINYGTNPPSNATYQIVVTDATGSYTYNRTINGGVTAAASNLAPTGTISNSPTFTFSGTAGSYSVNLFDASWTYLWGSPVGASTTIPYSGPALSPGTYNYQVYSWVNGNNAFAQASFTYGSASAIPYTPLVFNVHEADGNFYTYLDVTIGSAYAGTLPDAVTTINVTGPAGSTPIATRSDFVYYDTWREFMARLPGSPLTGTYTFEVSDGTLTTVMTDSQIDVRAIPVVEKSTFNYVPADSPIFGWGTVAYTDVPIYYRLILDNLAGDRIHSSSRIQNMVFYSVPSATLVRHQDYKMQVRVDDASSGNAVQNESRSDTVRFVFFTQDDFTAWGVQGINGVISGQMLDKTNNNSPVAGVDVRYASGQGKFYQVLYLNDDFTVDTAATATKANGRYLIVNVSPGDKVTITARKADWTFGSNNVQCFAGAVSFGNLQGNPGGASVTMYVKDKDNAPIAGATVRMAESTALTTFSDTAGKATLANLPLDTPLTFEVMKEGYRNSYSRNVVLTQNSGNWGSYRLFATSDTVSFGGIPSASGVIFGVVRNDANDSALAGAQVTYTSARGINNYPIVYLNNLYTNDGSQATSGNGYFAILNVQAGDTVVVTAHMPGWNFQPSSFTARANAVSQGAVKGVQAPYRVEAWSAFHHQQSPNPNSYWVGLQVRDDNGTIDSVTVTGPTGGNPQGVFNLVKDGNHWSTWTGTADIGPQFGSTLPAVPLHYTFVITEKATPEVPNPVPMTLTATVDSFVDVSGTQVSPSGGTVSGNPTFTWSGTIPQDHAYMVELAKVGGGFYWNSGLIPATVHTVDYVGQAPPSGDYTWNIMVRDMYGNFSMVISPSFTIEAKGDLDGINGVNLADAVIAMRVLSGLDVSSVIRSDYVASHTDVNGDDKVGLAELLYILQVIAGLR